MTVTPQRDSRDREYQSPKIGVASYALPFEVLRKLQVRWVACWSPGDEGKREGSWDSVPQSPSGPGPTRPSVHSWHRALLSIWQLLEVGGCAWET